ncbi:hypothetical protein AYI70_g189 [Smittium culicis]|uniref:Type 2A phosphatase-associated protein 42 n=1 Tax=Smittium culicis TaxID=133412 RepID=A0A1R1YHL3_9FUNG|nr:hypothetical protein AYI70_g189 [Smittium culicis]
MDSSSGSTSLKSLLSIIKSSISDLDNSSDPSNSDKYQILYESYYYKCKDIGVATKEDVKYFDLTSEEINKDPVFHRNLKIERFKIKKSYELLIQQLKKNKRNKKTTKPSTSDEIQSSVEDLEQESSDEEEEEESLRELLILILKTNLNEAIESIISLSSEIKLLDQFSKLKGVSSTSENNTSHASKNNTDKRINPTKKEVEWKLDGGDYSSTAPNASKKLVDKNVNSTFRPGHSLPTMTVDQFVDQELARGNFLSGGTEEPEPEEISDNDYEAIDAETVKKREWDLFVEQNPKGSGNTSNRG